METLKKYRGFILLLSWMFFIGCATTGDLRALRSEINQRLDEKIAAIDSDLSGLKKNVSTLDTMRAGQANTAADLSELKDTVQQLRGQIESLKKEFATNSKRDDQRLDNILLKINFIESFLEIDSKNASGASADKTSKSNDMTVSNDTGKKLDKEKAYSAAYQTFQQGHYDKARSKFQKFLENFPNSEYSDNAQFWIGECYFFEEKYEEAILEYDKVTKNYPNGNKVPYALLKQGLAFSKLGDKTSAKLLLQQVIKNYPNTSQARIARSSLQEIK